MFPTAPIRPTPASPQAQFETTASTVGGPAHTRHTSHTAALPSLAQSAEILSRLVAGMPRGRLTSSRIVEVARNDQGRYPAEIQAAAVQFHAQRHAVRAAFDALQRGNPAGPSLFGAIRGYRHADLQALADVFRAQASHGTNAAQASSTSAPPPAGWHMPSAASATGNRHGNPPRGDRIDEALCQLGRFMQRSQRAFLSVERLISMERSGSSPARHALDNISRWGRAVGHVVEERARLLLADLETRYGDLELLEAQGERAARQRQAGVFGYPGGGGSQAAEARRRGHGPVITEVSDSASGSGQPHVLPDVAHEAASQRYSGPVITEVEQPDRDSSATPQAQFLPRPRTRSVYPE